ncbi:VOC family protein [Actinomadura bangladeshensis]|uniref:VOC family protein n=1 Tax=Actinomadura bangladeshensis TaxID=453573 RepID=A0A4R4NKT7_9ACTN|nr:VOC family protein [Actinomadura bangladeshensis]TDC10011.1 VOC family protein [Actinomadura bangladeshensis]
MSIPAYNTVAWFQIGADAPEEARRFYGDMFGWRFAGDPGDEGYELITYPDAAAPSGGLAGRGGPHAVFFVLVEDVDAACAEAERHGGEIAVPPKTAASGLRFAHLQDPSGNRFGVFKTPSA